MIVLYFFPNLFNATGRHTTIIGIGSKEEGFPFPGQEMIGGWEILSAKNNASIVKIWWELVPNNPKLSWLLLPILGMKADKDFPKIIRNKELSTIDSKNKRKIVNKNRLKGKLLPTFC